MSYTGKVRTELLEKLPSAPVLRTAMAYGCLLFFYQNEGESLVQMTRKAEKAAGIRTILSSAEEARLTVETETPADGPIRIAVKGTMFGFSCGERPSFINLRLLKSAEQKNAFLAGAFYTCGSISRPDRGDRLEFTPPDDGLCGALEELLARQGFLLKRTVRRGKSVLYTKESSVIADLLTAFGATSCALEVMEAQIERALKNDVNRRNNCDTANIGKTMDASLRQMEQIRLLMESDRFYDLPEDLQEMALLRMANPELSLSELGRLTTPPMSRSGVNHRLQKLAKAAQAVSGEETQNIV